MSNDGVNNDRSIRIPTIVEGKFQVFRMKFKAVAAIKGFAEALEPGFKSQLPGREDMSLNLAMTDMRKHNQKQKSRVHWQFIT